MDPLRNPMDPYGPLLGDRLIVWLRDLNLPKPDAYDTIQVIVLITRIALITRISLITLITLISLRNPNNSNNPKNLNNPNNLNKP